MNLHTHTKDFTALITFAAARFNITPAFVEKDYWITLALSRLANSSNVENAVFKGGTSLSKGYRLINRFSEDIDIAMINENLSGNALKTKIRNIEKEITAGLDEIVEEGITSKGSMFRKSLFKYPTVLSGKVDSIIPHRLIVEINSFANPYPNVKQEITSFITEYLFATKQTDAVEEYGLQPFSLNVLDKRRTMIEKLVSLFRFSFSENPRIALATKIRHFYDLYYLANDAECAAYIQTTNFKIDFSELLAHDKQTFDAPENWQDKAIAQSPLVADFPLLWNELRETYQKELPKLAFVPVPDEKDVAEMFTKIIRQLKSPRIVFMGTPDFAVESLRALVENGYSVVGVVTTPDKPTGKHHSVLQACPVKEYALAQNLPVLQPEKQRDPDFLERLKAWKADLQIVVAFRMLPEVVWDMPPLGTFNLHASLLPQYRGAAPINRAIMNGEKETGVTTFFLSHGIDTGRVIFRERIPIAESDNAGIVHDRLMLLGAGLVIKTVDAIANNQIQPVEQEKMGEYEEELKTAPKIFKETCRIDWNKSAKEVYDFIRGLSPYPAAWTELTAGKGEILNLKIFESEKIIKPHALLPGTIAGDDKNRIDVAVQDGFIRLKTIQQAGKKRMTAEDFLRGNGHLFE